MNLICQLDLISIIIRLFGITYHNLLSLNNQLDYETPNKIRHYHSVYEKLVNC